MVGGPRKDPYYRYSLEEARQCGGVVCHEQKE